MEKKINIAELLKDCPKGMELDCTMFNGVILEMIDDDENCDYPILIRTNDGEVWDLTSTGCWNDSPSAKCVIFPKGKTTWEEFIPPCKFKDVDIIFTQTRVNWISIYKEFNNNYLDYCTDSDTLYTIPNSLCRKNAIKTQRLATEEEKQKLFDAIKKHGYKWNEETKTLEKLVEPKFMVGDTITKIDGSRKGKILYIDVDKYHVAISNNIGIDVFFEDQNDWKLIPNKFNITILKPFESRVLVRDYVNRMWRLAFWDKYIEDSNCSYLTTNGCYKQCIPYEGNEHLLWTTDDCDEFYKNW